MNFDARKVKKELCIDVQKLISRKSSSFDHATIYHVSVAAAPLAGQPWSSLRNLADYSAVNFLPSFPPIKHTLTLCLAVPSSLGEGKPAVRTCIGSNPTFTRTHQRAD